MTCAPWCHALERVASAQRCAWEKGASRYAFSESRYHRGCSSEPVRHAARGWLWCGWKFGSRPDDRASADRSSSNTVIAPDDDGAEDTDTKDSGSKDAGQEGRVVQKRCRQGLWSPAPNEGDSCTGATKFTASRAATAERRKRIASVTGATAVRAARLVRTALARSRTMLALLAPDDGSMWQLRQGHQNLQQPSASGLPPRATVSRLTPAFPEARSGSRWRAPPERIHPRRVLLRASGARGHRRAVSPSMTLSSTCLRPLASTTSPRRTSPSAARRWAPHRRYVRLVTFDLHRGGLPVRVRRSEEYECEAHPRSPYMPSAATGGSVIDTMMAAYDVPAVPIERYESQGVHVGRQRPGTSDTA